MLCPGDNNDSLVLETHQRNEGKGGGGGGGGGSYLKNEGKMSGGGGGGSYLKNEGKMSGDNNDSLELETHQRNEGKWGG